MTSEHVGSWITKAARTKERASKRSSITSGNGIAGSWNATGGCWERSRHGRFAWGCIFRCSTVGARWKKLRADSIRATPYRVSLSQGGQMAFRFVHAADIHLDSPL